MPKQSTLLGAAIRLQRESRNLLLRQVAAAIEVDTAFISKIERGEKKASRDQVIKLAGFLEANTDYLITLWLCDRVLHAVDNEPLAEQALQFALKNITTEA
jgi:transcriptional regulator with XRE-family HTH domain